MLSRTEVEVRRGAGLPKPPQERGEQMSDAALLCFMLVQVSAEIDVCGEPGCRRATRP